MNDSQQTDVLVAEVLRGDVDRYEELIKLYQREVWKVVSSARLDHDTSQDLVQQTFVQSYFSLAKYQPGTNFGFWIKGIARNLVKHEFRSMATKARHVQVYGEELVREWDDPDECNKNEDRRSVALADCMSMLAEGHSRVMSLKYEESLSLEDISRTIGKTIEATKLILWRSRMMVKECIEKKVGGQ
ncbi:MAG: hypothetical protein C0404_11410 [Verrucomicrobia bacterium]|nr:hypothetical protein [Verrucomicrobiota bacterium]